MVQYTYTDIKDGLFPTTTIWRKALKTAANTNLDKRDTRPLFYTLNVGIHGNSRLSGLITTRKTALTSFEWQITSEDPAKEQAAKDLTPILKRNIMFILSKHTDIMLKGSLLFEVVPLTLSADNVFPFELKYIDHYSHEKVNDTDFYLIDSGEDGKQFNKTLMTMNDPATRQKYLYYTDGLTSIGGVLVSVMQNLIYANDLISDWYDLSLRLKGAAVALVDWSKLQNDSAASGMDISKVINDLDTALADVSKTNSMKFPNSIEFQLARFTEAGSSESYNKFATHLNNDIAIAILGQANTTQLPNGGGSRAALQVLNMIRTDIMYHDMNNIRDVINHFLEIYYQLNSGSIDCPFKFVFLDLDTPDTESAAVALATLANSTIQLDFKKDEIYAKLGYSKPTDSDEIITIGGGNNIPMTGGI